MQELKATPRVALFGPPASHRRSGGSTCIGLVRDSTTDSLNDSSSLFVGMAMNIWQPHIIK